MVNSLLNTDPEKLSNLLSDPRGSHITDAFMLRFVFFLFYLKVLLVTKPLIFQFLLNFLLNTEPENLSNLLSDQRSSHITDAFMLRFVFFVLLKSGSSHKTIGLLSF